MNPQEALSLVPLVIERREPSPNGRWILCIRFHKILCIPSNKIHVTDIFICSVNFDEILNGFNNRQWNRIKIYFQKLNERDMLCENLFKP